MLTFTMELLIFIAPSPSRPLYNSSSCVHVFNDIRERLCHPTWCILHRHRMLWTRAEIAQDLLFSQRQRQERESVCVLGTHPGPLITLPMTHKTKPSTLISSCAPHWLSDKIAECFYMFLGKSKLGLKFQKKLRVLVYNTARVLLDWTLSKCI